MPTPYNIAIQDHCTECTLPKGAFCKLSHDSLDTLDHIKYTSVYPKGSLLFVEGEQPRGVFVLCSGRTKLTMSSSEGKRLITKIAEPGEIIGVSASILGTPYEVTAETVEPSQVNFIRREDFMKFLNSSPEVCMNAAQQLSAEHHSAQAGIRSLGLSQTTTEKPVDRVTGAGVSGGCWVTLPLTVPVSGPLHLTTRSRSRLAPERL